MYRSEIHMHNLRYLRNGKNLKICGERNLSIPGKSICLRLQLHGAIYRPDSFVLMLRHCVNLKAIRYESTSLNRVAADKSHSVIAA